MDKKIPTPEEYHKFLKGLQFANIRITNLNAKIDHELFLENKEHKLIINDKATYKKTDVGFDIENKFTLSSKAKGNKIILKIDCNFLLSFNSEIEISYGYFEIYRNLSLRFNTVPFFREVVHSITSRMDIPHLVIPLWTR